MKILKDPKYQFISILLLFFVVNVLQSHFTNLFEDEAYYYVWSKDLAFGYFDHPPMVALWAAIGNSLLPGELGLRLLSTLSFSATLWLVWLMIDGKEKWKHVMLFFTVIVSMVFWQVFGFIMTPDTPLLFFSALFLLSYKRFLKKETPLHIFLLAFSMAAMLYSKYHGILLIGFIVLSNLKLLKNPRFWMASITGFLLFLPHLYWQYENGFPSFLYHLKERNRKPYAIYKTAIHLVNMIAVVGITFPLIYKAFYKQNTQNEFQRGLKFVVYGFFFFFLLTTLKSEPQAQWLILIIIPLTLITFPYFIRNEKARGWLKLIAGIQLLIIIVIRLFFAIPAISPIELEPHVSDQWIDELKKNTEGKPVIFINSYRNASLYNFYTGIKTHSYSVLEGRKSQYNLVDFEAKMQGENVFTASRIFNNQPRLATKYSTDFVGTAIDDYQTFEKVQCIIQLDEIHLTEGRNNFEFSFINTYDKNIIFENVRFYGVFQADKNRVLAKTPLEMDVYEDIGPYEEVVIKASFELPDLPKDGKVTFRVAIEFYNLLEGFQGNKVPVVLKSNN
ncbi:ArnT family glycosyltransferase [Lutimonas sp.]|uniref:ArnT family glycosyltransferase n=1 Tax=Lutimonas sp. TaxID=1872403 RepID=UPI003D9AE80A